MTNLLKCLLPRIVVCFSIVTLIAACKDSSSDPDGEFTSLACSTTSADSTYNGSSVDRIRSETTSMNTYELVNVRNGSQSIDYMVHNNENPKALIILIAGGQLNAGITGIVGEQASTAGGNFLVRSAHLFAAQGFKVVTIDRPSDAADYVNPAGSASGSAFDGYRTSSDHFSDIQAIINQENASLGLPVVIAGTSRGTISAVAQQSLAEYVMLSGPLTGGSSGTPIGSSGVKPSSLGDKPVHLIWHKNDGCVATTPSGARKLAGDFSNITAVEVSGGIDHPELSGRIRNQACDGSTTYHGFLGIESCVVENATNWLDTQLQMP